MRVHAHERSHPVEEMLREYLPILVFLAVAIGLGLVLILAAVVLAVRNPDPEKLSAYECGFNAFDDARMKFDVRFYLDRGYHQLGAHRIVALDDLWSGLLRSRDDAHGDAAL
jgi:hypothetical protein